jgi:hypothetical protein
MKLAEALINRADAQKRIQQIRERLNRSARVQEGDAPPENPQELLEELRRTVDTFTDLVKRINRTNSQTTFQNGTLTDALADRDALGVRRKALVDLINAASNAQFRYGRSEIKYVSTVDVASLQREADDLARQYRELDSAIQQANWNVDLME